MNDKIEVNHTHSWKEVKCDEFLEHQNLGYSYSIMTEDVIRYLDKRDIQPPCEITVHTTGNDMRISGEEYVDVEVELEVI